MASCALLHARQSSFLLLLYQQSIYIKGNAVIPFQSGARLCVSQQRPALYGTRFCTKFANDCAEFLRYLYDDESMTIFRPYGPQQPFPSHLDGITPWGGGTL